MQLANRLKPRTYLVSLPPGGGSEHIVFESLSLFTTIKIDGATPVVIHLNGKHDAGFILDQGETITFSRGDLELDSLRLTTGSGAATADVTLICGLMT